VALGLGADQFEVGAFINADLSGHECAHGVWGA
jgi:hypothetical protein